MLRVLKRNPLQWISLHQITQTSITNPIFPQNFYSFSTASNSPPEPIKTKDLILDFFRPYGFTDTKIEKLFQRCSSVRSTQTFKPKLEHLLAFGFSPSDLIKIICFFPRLLGASLKERIEPNLSLLEATFSSKTHVIKAVKRGPWLLTVGLEKQVIPNLELLRVNGVPMEKIICLFIRYPLILGKDPDLVAETITKMKGLGMSPSNLAFIHGMAAMASMKKETWERKMKLYLSFGWSEEQTLSAFARQPICLQLSDEKIRKQMEFCIEKLQWESEAVLKYPLLLMYSLEGRIIPRCSVLNVLAKNGLWVGKVPTIGVFTMSEKKFRERFVDKYGKEAPQVFDAYQGKVEFKGVEPSIVVPSRNPSETCVAV